MRILTVAGIRGIEELNTLIDSLFVFVIPVRYKTIRGQGEDDSEDDDDSEELEEEADEGGDEEEEEGDDLDDDEAEDGSRRKVSLVYDI